MSKPNTLTMQATMQVTAQAEQALLFCQDSRVMNNCKSTFTLKSHGRFSFNSSFIFFFLQNNSRKLNRKMIFDLPRGFILRNLLGNNTPQAYAQFRLITAQTEGLLVSGGLK